MPSMMIHLLAAKKVRPAASPLFLIGNLAPDGVNTREIKDKSHYRDIKDREGGLRMLALALGPGDDYEAGVLLHLFLDWKWDEAAFIPFKSCHESTNPDWFKEYRNQISLASTWLFHNCAWVEEAGDEILGVELSRYGRAEGVTPQDVSNYLKRAFTIHRENKTAPSSTFTPEFVDSFIENTVCEFHKWYGNTVTLT